MKKKKNAVLPSHVTLTIDVGRNDLCDFVYRERFDRRDAKTVARTAELIENAIRSGAMPDGVTMERDGKLGIGFVGKGVRRVHVGNMLFGEFLLWSSTADLTLRDFVVASVFTGRATAGVKVGE